MSPAEIVTFVLALVAYALLGWDAIQRVSGRAKPWITIATAACASAHALMVWHVRYAWSFDAAVARGSAPFALFHVVWLLVIVAVFVPRYVAERVVPSCFAILSIAAVPAPFRYDGLEALRIPVIAIFAIALIGIGSARNRTQARSRRSL